MLFRTAAIAGLLVCVSAGNGQPLPPELKAKAEARAKIYAAWGTAPEVVAAVRAFNTSPPVEASSMSPEKWKMASVLDPFVRSFTRNSLALFLKAKKDANVGEIFVSGANGTKAAFLAKPSNWSHKGKDKHDIPMRGKVWIGPVEVDDSTGEQQIQIAVPVLDGGRPIGSIVVGVKRVSLL